MKPLHATWVIDMYNTITQTPSVVISGWKAAGILEAVTQGSSRIPAIDPFFEIDNRNFDLDMCMDNSQIISINDELRVLEINSRDENDGDGDLEGDSDWEERE